LLSFHTVTFEMPAIMSPNNVDPSNASAFLENHPTVQGIDVVMTDCHGIGRGKLIRRHELATLYTSGRPMPASLFGQDVAGDDVPASGLVLSDAGGDKRCWPIPGTLGLQPHVNRGQVLVSMYEPDGTPFGADPRHVLVRQCDRARELGMAPMGAFELELYFVDRERDARGRYQPARYVLTGRRASSRNTMAVDELDEMSPLFEAIYEGAGELGVPLESLISEYAVGQYELTIRYRDLLRAADDVIIAKRLIRSVARRFELEACFMAKPFGQQAGSGMHLHLSLTDHQGRNLFADAADGRLNSELLHAIGGVRHSIPDTMLILAPHLNSWRRFASAVYSPVSDLWGIENRTVAIRVPGTSGEARHLEHRLAGVDANPYMVAAVTLAAALDGIAAKRDPGPPAQGNGYSEGFPASFPRSWLDAIDRCEQSKFIPGVLGEVLHRAFIAIKRAEWQRMAVEVSEAEWELYGFVV
jgi:glutamine synthetase